MRLYFAQKNRPCVIYVQTVVFCHVHIHAIYILSYE